MHCRPGALALAIALLALAVSGCGRDEGAVETKIVGDTLTVYSSLPLTGPLAPLSDDLVRAEKLALKEAQGKAGVWKVSYVSLSSADPETGETDPGKVAANARRAVQTPNAVAYLGELEPGASTTAVPILNAGGIFALSPRDTYAGLTEAGPGGEPDRWYPSGRRSFARVVPPADAEAEALVARMRTREVQRLAIVVDEGSVAGRRLADAVAPLAEEAGMGVERTPYAPTSDVGLGFDERVDAVLYAGGATGRAFEILQRAHVDAPRAWLYAGDALAVTPGLAEKLGPAADRFEATTVDPGVDAGFARRFAAEYGREPLPQAVLGYRAMRLALETIADLGADASSRRRVIRRGVELVGAPRANIAVHRIEGERLVSVGPRM